MQTTLHLSSSSFNLSNSLCLICFRILYSTYFIYVYISQVGTTKSKKIGGVVTSEACIDLLIANVLDNLPVPRISKPSSRVPEWNQADVDDFVETLFAFAVQHLSDDGAILLFLPESSSIRKDVLGWAHEYGYIQYKDRWGIDEL